MAAYGAAISLLKTLKKLKRSLLDPLIESSPYHPRIKVRFFKGFLVANTEVKAEFEIQINLEPLFKAVRLLKRFLLANREVKAEFETLIKVQELFEAVDSLRCFLVENRGGVKAEFETEIREAIYEAQDIIDIHTWSAHFLSRSDAEISSDSFHDDLERLTQNINSIALKTTEEFNHLTLDRKISASVWRNSDKINFLEEYLPGYRMIGRHEDIKKLKDQLMKGSDALQVVPIVGVAGMGKTTLARCLLKDSMIVKHFDAIGWVKVSVKCSKRDKLLDIIASLRKSSNGTRAEVEELIELQYSWNDEILQKTEKQLVEHIYNSLKYKRYIILLDDIRDVASWNDLKELFPDHHKRSRILLTTRDVKVAPAPAPPHQLRPLSDKAAFDLLAAIVFHGKPRHAHLEIIAKNIASKCQGLPHAVVIVGKLLSCANHQTAEYWEIVLSSIISKETAQKKSSKENYADLIEALLSLTYNHLPQQLKVCLLYLAIFPYNCAIPFVKLQLQWIVEGFIGEVGDFESMSLIAAKSNNELTNRGFLVQRIKSSDIPNASVRIAEEVFHDFLVRKAKEEKFFLVINKDESYAFRHGDTTYNQQRRLCIQHNIYHFIKDLSTCNTNSLVRSLIYAAPEHQYRIGAWSEKFKLLEVLDAVKIGFYTIPPEILELIQLKYLAFSYNGQLPPALCNLQRLQVLIVSQYLNMKCSGVPSYLPVEIWNLKDLIHLQVEGSDLLEPPSGTKLEQLRCLLEVSARSCTRNIFERIPKLATLEVRIESSQEEETLSFFSYLDILENLHSFKCVVIYPHMGSEIVPCSIPVFPFTIRNLTLNGCGFPWEYMRSIAALPQLTFLNLHSYAFQGPDWEVKIDEFPKLYSLLLEDMDFENWTFDSSTGSIFPVLESLIIRNCYKLRHIPSVFADSLIFDSLEVVDCSTSAMNSALQIKEVMRNRENHPSRSHIYSSRDED